MIPRHFLARLFFLSLLVVLCDLFASDAQAGIGSFFSGIGSRTRVVQFCVLTMVVALVILMKKFSPHPHAFAPKMNYAPFEDDKVTR